MTRPYKTAYLHIGGEKTGTTALQNFLALNRGKLAKAGVVYPESPGGQNHMLLAKYAQADFSNAGFLKNFRIPDKAALEALHRDFRRAFLDEVTAAAKGADTLVLSSEHCQSEVRRPKDARRLAALLHEVAEDVRIVFYIRRQDEIAVSLFSTALKVGFALNRSEFKSQVNNPQYDHWRVSQLYESVFGADALDIRLYQDAHRAEGGLVGDFGRVIGLDLSTDRKARWRTPAHENRSLNKAAQALLYTVNRWPDGPLHPETGVCRLALVRALEQGAEGRGLMPGRARAQTFAGMFAEDNEALRRHFLPDRPAPLFGDDFSRYPEEDKPLELMAPDDVVVYLKASFPKRKRLLGATEAYVVEFRDRLTAL
ncbi:hypothetical protein [Kordiimonas marina]|uniref:hypothetical protein n=1 Tax=Kordiimonas marina TaxID=2872312 RepID=UPI001FF4F7CE|nr:hypothetical protein [Kordiimonas marina]MCJ9429804.1 hypothetical protein [Kordiimonas marina]